MNSVWWSSRPVNPCLGFICGDCGVCGDNSSRSYKPSKHTYSALFWGTSLSWSREPRDPRMYRLPVTVIGLSQVAGCLWRVLSRSLYISVSAQDFPITDHDLRLSEWQRKRLESFYIAEYGKKGSDRYINSRIFALKNYPFQLIIIAMTCPQY